MSLLVALPWVKYPYERTRYTANQEVVARVYKYVAKPGWTGIALEVTPDKRTWIDSRGKLPNLLRKKLDALLREAGYYLL